MFITHEPEKKLPLRMAVLIVSVLMYCGCACGCSDNWNAAKIAESKQIGEEILDAIGRYMEEHGKPPESLSKLVPEYLSEIKPPVAGNGKWNYLVKKPGALKSRWGNGPEGPDCQLSFGCGKHHYPNYLIKLSARDKGWLYDH